MAIHPWMPRICYNPQACEVTRLESKSRPEEICGYLLSSTECHRPDYHRITIGHSQRCPENTGSSGGPEQLWPFACCKQHHTYANVVEQGEFVVNIPGPELIGRISDGSQEFPEGADDLAAIDLSRFPSLQVWVPSIPERGVNIECVRHAVLDVRPTRTRHPLCQ